MKWLLRILVLVGLVVATLPLSAGPAAAATNQPDGLIRLSSDSALLGDDVYNLDGAGQTRSVPIAPNSTAAFLYRVQNDDPANSGSIKVTGPVGTAPFTVRYYSGFNDVTDDVTGYGYFRTVAPGQSFDLSVQLTPSYSAPAGTAQSVSVTATWAASPEVKDVVTAVATVAGTSRRPDGMLRRLPETDFLGDGVYNLDGTEQFAYVTAGPGVTPTVLLRVQNDSNVADSIVVTGPSSTASFDVRYSVGSVDVTDAVTHAGYTTPVLTPGATADLSVQVVGKVLASDAQFAPAPITVASVSAPSVRDVVKVWAAVVAAGRRPDGMVRRSTDTTLRGNDVFNTDGADQTIPVTMTPGVTYSFLLRMQNDGTVTDQIRVRGSAGAAPFTVRYTSAYFPVTAEVTGGGMAFSNLAPGATADLSVQITPSAEAPTGASQTVSVSFSSDVDLPNPPTDVIKIVATVQRPPSFSKPDGLVRLSSDSSLLGDGVYNLDATNQTRSTSILPGSTRSFLVRVQNDGPATDSIVVTGPTSSPPFSVRYFRGYTEVTAAVIGTGLNLAGIPAGGSVDLSVQITASSNAVNGARQALSIRLTSAADALARDVVKVEGVVAGGPADVRPDALIRRAGESTYVGDDVYGTDGSGQTRATSIAAGGIAAFGLRVQNGGNVADSIVVTGPELDGAFTARYYRAYIDITSAVNGGGYTIANLAPGASVDLQVQIIASGTAASGATQVVLTRFASSAVPTFADVVASRATVS